MPEIYCTKCGIRGNSKCPHCRSVFSNSPDDWEQRAFQDYFEMFMSVGLKDADDRKKLEAGEDARFVVSFWTYETSEDAAIASILASLHEALPKVNITTAACVHDWQLMPGEISSIGCGHGAPAGAVVPPDPYTAA